MTSSGNNGDQHKRDAEHMRLLLERAIDDALVKHVSALITNWMIDSMQQPTRAFTGIGKAIVVWEQAMAALRDGELTS